MSVDLGSVGGREFDRGYAGQVADGCFPERISRTVEGSGGAPWGACAAQGDTGGAVPFDASHTQIVGVFEKNPMHPALAGVAAYKQYDAASIVEKGDIFILAAEDYRDGDKVVILNPASPGITTGTFGASKGGAANETTRVSFPGNTTYEAYPGTTGGLAGSLAKIHIRSGRAPRTTS